MKIPFVGQGVVILLFNSTGCYVLYCYVSLVHSQNSPHVVISSLLYSFFFSELHKNMPIPSRSDGNSMVPNDHGALGFVWLSMEVQIVKLGGWYVDIFISKKQRFVCTLNRFSTMLLWRSKNGC